MTNLTKISIVILVVAVLAIPAISNAQYYYNYAMPFGSCTYHAYKLCVGNNIYWYSGCNQQQDLYQTCQGGQTCQYGQCVMYIQPAPNPNPVLPPYNPYYRTACYNNSVHWFDSLGVESGLYKNCNDDNPCTQDTCSANTCVHTLISNCQETITAPVVAPAVVPTNLLVSFFAKQDASSVQWQKTAEAASNSNVYFMISVSNNSTTQIDNVNVSGNIPTEISSLGNLQLNNVPVSGDIVSGINIGSIAPATTKSITFEGKTQIISAIETKQATASINVAGVVQTAQSDSVSINLNPRQISPAVSGISVTTPGTSSFGEFLKRWYLWILAGVVILALFVVVFRRLSSEA